MEEKIYEKKDYSLSYGGYELMFPGDKSLGAPGHTLYNCRCTMGYVDKLWEELDKGERWSRDPETGRKKRVPWLTYDEWEKQKIAENEKIDEELFELFGASAGQDLKNAVARSTIKLKNGFACFPKDDVLNTNIKKVTPIKGVFDVAMHGTPSLVGFGTTEGNMSARTLSAVIRHMKGYKKQKVRLLSCNTGKTNGDNYCFAEELSNALGVEVTAPNGTLYVFPDGTLRVGEDGTGEFVTFKPNQRRRRK